jgi:hypothetical protein
MADPAGALSSSSSGGPTFSNPPVLQGLTCNPDEDPAPTPIKRLSKIQYANSMRSVFNVSGGYDAFVGPEIYKDISMNYALIPADSKVIPGTGITTALTGFDRTDSTVGQYHVDGYFFVAVATANAFVSDDNRILNVFKAASGECSTLPPTDACVLKFINRFGTRAMKRPIKPDEVQSYKAMYDATSTGGYKDGLSSLVMRFVMSPQFLYQVETEGTPVKGREDLLQLTGYELAARLSYSLIDDLPPPLLFNAAADGSLQSDSGIQNAVSTLMTANSETLNYQDPLKPITLGDGESTVGYQWNFKAGEVTVDTFFNQWLKLYAIPAFDYNNPNLAALADMYGPTYLGAGPALHHSHYSDMMLEVENLYNHYFWNAKGSYRDLMTTDKLAYRSGDVQAVLGQPAWTGGDWKQNLAPMPSYPPNTRNGILTRAAFQISSNENSNPVKRGVFIQRQILCRQLPSPDPAALPDRSLEAPEMDPHLTTRDRFTTKTSFTTCMACHSFINPTGFAFENFDSVGRIRSQEAIFDSNSKLIGQPTINSTATVPLNSTMKVIVSDGASLSRAIATSGAGDECFARQYFRYFYGRTEAQGDGCAIKDLTDTSLSGSMLDVFQRIPQQKSFKLHKVGPQ